MTKTDSTSHTHALTEIDKALAAEATTRKAADDALEVRIAKLEVPPVTPPVEPPPVVGKSVTVTSVASLISALGDDANDEIVVANNTYGITGAGFQATNSLWIDHRRTRPVMVRAATPYGVTFDGGSGGVGHITFVDGACLQTWDGFVLAGGVVKETGSVVMGDPGLPAPHDITLRRFKVLASVKGSGTTAQGSATDHAIYGSWAIGGPHHFTLEDWDIDCSGGLASGFHFYHSDAANPCCHDWLVRRFAVKRAQQAIIHWDPTCRNMVFEDGTITSSTSNAVTYKHPTSGNVLRRITSTGSGQVGLYAPNGQAGLTVEACSLA